MRVDALWGRVGRRLGGWITVNQLAMLPLARIGEGVLGKALAVNLLSKRFMVMASGSMCFVPSRECDEEMLSDERDNHDEVPGEVINIVVAQLKRVTRCATLEFALRVGAIIIHHFYDGDTSAWRSRGAKNASFRRLAQHPELPLSAGSLYRCVALFELCDRLKAPSRWEHLGASHLRLVLGLPPDVQVRVLTEANEHRWTVKMLQDAVSREKGMRVSRGGRRAQPAVAKSLRMLRKCLDANRSVLEEFGMVDSELEVEDSARLLEEIRSSLESFAQSIHVALRRRESLRPSAHGRTLHVQDASRCGDAAGFRHALRRS